MNPGIRNTLLTITSRGFLRGLVLISLGGWLASEVVIGILIYSSQQEPDLGYFGSFVVFALLWSYRYFRVVFLVVVPLAIDGWILRRNAAKKHHGFEVVMPHSPSNQAKADPKGGENEAVEDAPD